MDEWFDRALSTYVNPEIPAGLEQRILARARASKTRLTPWVLIAATVCLVCVGVILFPRQRPLGRQIDAAMALPRVRSQITAATAPLASKPLRHPVTPATLPKREVFPVAVPVPAPEVELARLSLGNPGVAQGLLAERDTGEPKPIHIEPLSIKLLDED
ncbi:MAG TPA: hypothetical protein VG345_05220 [Bryobacteraceae bacterium]|jgi:hypothetical protein|nr:hypothetical protein [Bryobacteraceae bacterium]